MTKRGIEESLASSAFAGTASPQSLNGSGLSANLIGPVLDASFILDPTTVAAEAYAHLGVLDPVSALGPMMPNMKKMKLGNGEGAIPTIHSGSTSTSPNSSSSGGNGSRVVHMRSIPTDTTYGDLYQLAAPFGRITQHLLMKNKHQAFIEFELPQSASQMVNYWQQSTIGGVPTQIQPSIRGRHVHCQLSNHKELNFVNAEMSGDYPMSDRTGTNGSNGATNGDGATTSTPSPVIRVVIENMLYSVTLDALHQIFSRSGKVHKIVTFTKNGVFQALVQYEDLAQAIQAKLSLDGAHMFAGGANTLRVEYSKLSNLIVKYNNEKSRDYTNPSLGSGNSRGGGGGHHDGRGGSSSMNGGSSADLDSLLAAASGHPFGSSYGSPGSVRGHNYGPSLGGPSMALMSSGLVSPSMLSGGPGLGGMVISPVIHVSGLTTDQNTTPDALFTLFGVYGDVLRVKILFNKKDTALIQMSEPNQAHLAISHLDRTRLHGKTLRVSSSKHQVVQLPKDPSQQESGLTKDYTGSPLHRFKRPGSKNYNNIYPPSETLHISNIPSTLSEDELREAFAKETGKEIAKFKFFPNDRRMALIQFYSVEDSIVGLIKMHNFRVADHSHLRVSFSKSPV